jgi:MFS family permease
MLEDKAEGFAIPNSQVGVVPSELTMWSIPFSMVTTIFVGYSYEILGRKLTIFWSYFLTGLIFIAIPYTAPNYTYMVILRCAVGVTMSAPMAHPLIPDYVMKKSRGKAVALTGVGLVVGEVFSMGVLFKYTMSMSYKDAFLLTGSFIIFISMVFMLIIKNPDMVHIREKIPQRASEVDIPKSASLQPNR